MSVTARSTDTMQICFRVLRKVKIDDNIDGLYIDPTSQEIRAHKITADSIAKVMKHPIAIVLQHLGMGVETGEAEFSDLLRKKFNPVCGVAEYDGLIDLELREKSVEAMHFLLLLHKTVILCDSSKCKLVH